MSFKGKKKMFKKVRENDELMKKMCAISEKSSDNSSLISKFELTEEE